MKKNKKISLSLNKIKISRLEAKSITGGATHYVGCRTYDGLYDCNSDFGCGGSLEIRCHIA